MFPGNTLDIPVASFTTIGFCSPKASKVRTQKEDGTTPKEIIFITPSHQYKSPLKTSILHQASDGTSTEYMFPRTAIILENAKLISPALLTDTPPIEIQTHLSEPNTNGIYCFYYPNKEVKLITKVKVNFPTTPWYRSETVWLNLKLKIEKRKEPNYEIKKHMKIELAGDNETTPAKTCLTFGLCTSSKAIDIISPTPRHYKSKTSVTSKAVPSLAAANINSSSQSIESIPKSEANPAPQHAILAKANSVQSSALEF